MFISTMYSNSTTTEWLFVNPGVCLTFNFTRVSPGIATLIHLLGSLSTTG